jgi:hypothetical protein
MLQVNCPILHEVGLTAPLAILEPPPLSHPLKPSALGDAHTKRLLTNRLLDKTSAPCSDGDSQTDCAQEPKSSPHLSTVET